MTLEQASQRTARESSTLHLVPLVEAGDRIRFLGRNWAVNGILYSRDFRPFFSLSDEDDVDLLEFAAVDGSDGGYELLPPAAARDSDKARLGVMVMPGTRSEPAVTLAPSPAVAVDVAAAAASKEASSHGGPGEPGTGADVSLRETAGASSEAISSPVDDWRFPSRPWRP